MRFLLIALLACAALPAGAEAATVSCVGGTLRYEASKGDRISGSVVETSGGAFLARMAKTAHQRLVPGAGCKRSQPLEVRCGGRGVVRAEISLKRARTSSLTLRDIRVTVATGGSAGRNSLFVSGTPDFTYDGGPGRDSVNVESPDGRSTIRLGAGLDYFAAQLDYLHGSRDSPATFAVDGGPGRDRLVGGPGADSLDGGPGADSLEGGGGADTLTGGTGADTVVFGTLTYDPNHDDGPISVTLDGQRNDGSAGQNALVGPTSRTRPFSSPHRRATTCWWGTRASMSWSAQAASAGSAAMTLSSPTTITRTVPGHSTAGMGMTGSARSRQTRTAASAVPRRPSPAAPVPTSSSPTSRCPPTASAPTWAGTSSARNRSAARASSARASTAATRAGACWAD